MEQKSTKVEMSRDEYYAFRQMIGMLNTLLNQEDELKSRCRMVKNGWRDYRMLTSVCAKLWNKMFRTIPIEQQKKCKKELEHTTVKVEVRKPQENEAPDIFTYVPQRPLERLQSKVIGFECQFCDKCGKKVSRCQTRKDMEELYAYPIHRLPDGSCPFQGVTKLSYDEI